MSPKGKNVLEREICLWREITAEQRDVQLQRGELGKEALAEVRAEPRVRPCRTLQGPCVWVSFQS